jgi:hypothetical protein
MSDPSGTLPVWLERRSSLQRRLPSDGYLSQRHEIGKYPRIGAHLAKITPTIFKNHRMNKILITCITAGLGCGLMVSGRVEATIITVEFTGVVNTVTGGTPPGSPGVGDRVSGYFKFDTETPDTDPANQYIGHYYQTLENGFSIDVGGQQFNHSGYLVHVFNGVPNPGSPDAPPWDAFSVVSSAHVFSGVGFQDMSRDIFGSDALPRQLSLDSLLPIDAAGLINGATDGVEWRTDFTLLTMNSFSVPEPGTIPLLCAGLVAMFGARRFNPMARKH